MPGMPLSQLQHCSWVGWRHVQLLLYLSVAFGTKWRKALVLTGQVAPTAHADSAPPSKEFHLGDQAGELSYTRRAYVFPQALTGIIKRQGDKVMHSDIKHVFLSAEQLLCHSSEQKVALLTGRTQPTCSYAHEDTTVPASGPGTEAHTEATQ